MVKYIMNKFINSLICSLIVLSLYLIYDKKQGENYIKSEKNNRYILIVSVVFSGFYFLYDDKTPDIIEKVENTLNNPKVPF